MTNKLNAITGKPRLSEVMTDITEEIEKSKILILYVYESENLTNVDKSLAYKALLLRNV